MNHLVVIPIGYRPWTVSTVVGAAKLMQVEVAFGAASRCRASHFTSPEFVGTPPGDGVALCSLQVRRIYSVNRGLFSNLP